MFRNASRRDPTAAVEWRLGAPILLCALTMPSLLAALQLPQGVPQAEQRLVLEIVVNGEDTGKLGEFILRRGTLLTGPEVLRGVRILVPEDIHVQPDGLLALSDLSGLTWKIDQAKQVLELTAAPARLMLTALQVSPWNIRRKIESGTGVTLNYSAIGTFASGQAGGTSSFDLRSFAPWGILSSDWLTFEGSSAGKNPAIRLDSAYTYADVNTLRRYTLGDFVSGGLSWTRPVHLEGIQIRSDFSTRPDLITFPMPAIGGSTAVPSTVTVLANGNVVSSSQVAAGPFQIQQLPVISGAGTLTLTVTNALGQQVTLNQPFYASSTLLAPGLQTYSIQAGLVRRNWGSLNNDDGKAAGLALYRRGLRRWLTLEGATEGTPGVYMASAGGTTTLGHLGAVNFAVAGSNASGKGGILYSLGMQRVTRAYSLGGSAVLANRNYRDVASMNGTGIYRKQIGATATLSLKQIGSISAAYAGLDQDAPPVLVPGVSGSATHSKVLSTNYFLQFRRVGFFAAAYHNFAGVSQNNQVQMGLMFFLGKQQSASVSGTTSGSGQVQAQKTVVYIGDWGYQGYVAADDSSNHEFGQLEYKSKVGLFRAGMDALSGEMTGRIEAQGALSFIDGSLFPSNFVFDSFGIVNTAPVGHVHVLQENREIGTTNRAGKMLVPDMRSFELNRIGVVASDVPPDVSLTVDARQIRPQDRSGVVIRFPMKLSYGALLKLVDESGTPLPVGSVVTLGTTGAAYSVGYDGAAYVEGLSSQNELQVRLPNEKICTVSFAYKRVPGELLTIGPLRCIEKKP